MAHVGICLQRLPRISEKLTACEQRWYVQSIVSSFVDIVCTNLGVTRLTPCKAEKQAARSTDGNWKGLPRPFNVSLVTPRKPHYTSFKITATKTNDGKCLPKSWCAPRRELCYVPCNAQLLTGNAYLDLGVTRVTARTLCFAATPLRRTEP